MQILNRVLLIGLCSFALLSCLEDRKTKSVPSVKASWFDGIKSVQNLGGYPSAIKIEWRASERAVLYYRVYSLVEDTLTGLTSWTLLEEVAPDILSYVHSNLNSGQVYSYKIQAIGVDEVEDGNTHSLSTVAFEGVSAVTITGKTTATVALNSSTGAFDEVRVYATPKSGGAKALVATAKGNVSTINVTNLRSGTTYRFNVNAYMKYLSSEDGNTIYVEDQTHSDTYGSGTSIDMNFSYRGVLNVQAFGLAPNAPLIPTATEDPTFSTKFPNFLQNPRVRMVRLTWLPFVGASSSTKYKVLRVAGTNTFDVNATEPCTDTRDTSCVVCTIVGSQMCTDSNVAAPPKKYDYIVSLVKRNLLTNEEWVEELPKVNPNDFRVSVHIPPENMVLVQRDAANYEMCVNMGRSSDPRKKQRCAYAGVGERPYNSGPGKPPLALDSGYYDLGYNFFTDRYRMACNWTRTAGACGKPDGCIQVTATHATDSSTNPSNSIGAEGDVMYSIGYYKPNCYIKKGGNWRAITDSSLTLAERNAMTRIDPGPDGGKHYPPLSQPSAEFGFYTCQSKSSEYGNKRLLRRREHLVAAAFSMMNGEPNAVDDMASRIHLEHLVNGHTYYECPTSSTLSKLRTTPNNIGEMVASTNTRTYINIFSTQLPYPTNYYFIGTQATIRCQTRWGAQDQIAQHQLGTPLSDNFIRINGTTTYPMQIRGDVADFDSGNKDFVGIEFGTGMATNLPNDSIIAWKTKTLTSGNITDLGTKFIPALGINIKNWTGVAAQDLWNFLDLYINGLFGGDPVGVGGNDQFMIDNSSYSKVQMYEGSRGRWSYSIWGSANSAAGESSLWCGVEAE